MNSIQQIELLTCPACYGLDVADCFFPRCVSGELTCECGALATVMRKIGSADTLEPVCEACIAMDDGDRYRHVARATYIALDHAGRAVSTPVVYANWIGA